MVTFEDRVKDIRGKVQGKAKDQQNLSSGTSTAAASKQLTATATGKAGPSGPTGQSNIGEQMAQQSTLGQLDSVDQQTNQQLDSMQLQAQQADVQQKAVESDRRSKDLQLDTQRSIQTDNILSEFRNGNLDLDSEKGQHELQVLGSQMARNNKRYMQKIKSVAAKKSINDKASHIKEGTRLQIGSSKTELYEQLGFLNKEGGLQRDYKEKVAMMGADDWFKVADAAIADEREAKKISAITGAAQAGVSAYGAGAFDSKGAAGTPAQDAATNSANTEKAKGFSQSGGLYTGTTGGGV